jgi:hypothetical protein
VPINFILPFQVARFVAIVTVLASPLTLRADDSAVSVAAGGLQLRHEARISMQRERLEISPAKVTVDFVFLNETDTDITTEVAFVVPEYSLDQNARTPSFEDFRVSVDGHEVKYEIESRAFVEGKDKTEHLERAGVDIASFGHVDGQHDFAMRDLENLPTQTKTSLRNAGLIDDSKPQQPLWSVRKLYHWQQTFPVHALVHIQHSYTPVIGYTQIETDDLDPAIRAKKGARKEDPFYRRLIAEPIQKVSWLSVKWRTGVLR